MNIRKRLEALEKGILRDPITLTMPDGRAETIPDHGRYLLRLFLAAIGQESLSPKQGELGFDSSIDGRKSHDRPDPLFPARSCRRP